MKLQAILCRATQDSQVIVKSSDKMWSTGEGNGNPLQYSCLENHMDSIKRQRLKKKKGKDMMQADEPLRSEGAQYATGEKQRAITSSSSKNEVAGPKQE